MIIERLNPKDKPLFIKLCEEARMDFPLIEECEYIVAKNEIKLKGALGYRQGELYPELQYIILEKKTNRKIALDLIEKYEQSLIYKGFKKYVIFIENINNKLQIYAQRLGYIPCDSNKRGVWFYKKIFGLYS